MNEKSEFAVPYCAYCGQHEELCSTGYFDTATGKQISSYRCMNKNCQIGCGNNSGHNFTAHGILALFTEATCCRYCGVSDSKLYIST